MPVYLWNDPDGAKYRAAYFDVYPGVWRHGDWITITDRGSVVIHGRSDATLNRHGVRLGSADIYQVVEQLPGIREALVIGVDQPDGGYWMPLFVVLDDGRELGDGLRETINGGAAAGRLAAARAGRDLRRVRHPAHPDRQEARGADQADPARRTSWPTCSAWARWTTRARWTRSLSWRKTGRRGSQPG